MSTSYNRNIGTMPRLPVAPVTAYQYRDLSTLPQVPRGNRSAVTSVEEPEAKPVAEVQMTRAELESLLAAARTDAEAATAQRLHGDLEKKLTDEAARIGSALVDFERERSGYFARVEGEVVRLSLSIAAKILHREAQVDPMLVAALVQIALNQFRENTAVTIRVDAGSAEAWRERFAESPQAPSITVVADTELGEGECLLETDMGKVNFSLDAQLKEVEQGFFDILAQTPKG